jgi:hypothetical protein
MFGFVRWLLLVAIIAALAGFSLVYRLHGQTPAERVCRLTKSTSCTELAVRWGERARKVGLRFGLEPANVPPAKAAVPRPAQRPPHLKVTDATRAGTRDAQPLDRETVREKLELDRILAQRASH